MDMNNYDVCLQTAGPEGNSTTTTTTQMVGRVMAMTARILCNGHDEKHKMERWNILVFHSLVGAVFPMTQFFSSFFFQYRLRRHQMALEMADGLDSRSLVSVYGVFSPGHSFVHFMLVFSFY